MTLLCAKKFGLRRPLTIPSSALVLAAAHAMVENAISGAEARVFCVRLLLRGRSHSWGGGRVGAGLIVIDDSGAPVDVLSSSDFMVRACM
jgi:CBS domain-containing protein